MGFGAVPGAFGLRRAVTGKDRASCQSGGAPALRPSPGLKEISPGISLEGMMLKLKLQYFGYLMQRVDSLEKTLMLGGIGGRRQGCSPFLTLNTESLQS